MLFILICLFLTCALQVHSSGGTTEKRLLNDGNRMPAKAYGTFAVDFNDLKYMTRSVIWAIEAGYRHIDTAPVYLSEDLIGEAIKNVTRRGIVRRSDLFITTKLPYTVCKREEVITALRHSLKRLLLDYVDLYLIHTPLNVFGLKKCDYLDVWKGLEDAKTKGLTKSIGVSNFNATNINRILVHSKTPPAVNEIEINPTYTNLELVAYCQSKNIVVNGYASLGFLVDRPFRDLSIPPTFNDPTLVGLAKKNRVKTSQIVLRHSIDRFIVPITASLDKEHIKSNVDISNFTMSPEDILIINEFDKNIKVYQTYENSVWLNGYDNAKKYIEENNLKQYKNIIL